MCRVGKYLRSIVKPLVFAAFGALLITLRYILRTPQPLKSVLPGETHHYTWTDGHIFYKVAGAENALPIVLVHTPEIGASSYEMRNIVDSLSRTFRVYTLDLLGFGLSDRPRCGYSAHTYVSLIHNFLKDVVAQSALLLASGLSCNYSIAVAANEPELCKGLVLLSPVDLYIHKRSSTWLRYLFEHPLLAFLLYAFLTARIVLRQVIAIQHTLPYQYVTSGELDYIFASAHQTGAHYAVSALLSGKLALPVSLAQLRQPSLVIQTMQAAFAAPLRSQEHALAHVRVVSLPVARGRVHEEHPAQVIANVLAWWQTVSAAQSDKRAYDATPTAAATAPAVEESEHHQAESEVVEHEQQPVDGTPEQPVITGTEPERQPSARLSPQNEALEQTEMAKEQASVEAYCVKCRMKRPILHPMRVVTKNGRNAMAGTCSVCGTRLFRFIAS